jgi:hypothetical protein
MADVIAEDQGSLAHLEDAGRARKDVLFTPEKRKPFV